MELAAALPSSWEELPPDLLGLVLRRLPSLADRVRLRAVCRPWRAGAQPQRHKPLPPPLPWLALLDGTLVDLYGAPVHCAPILREGVFRYLAVDNLAFLVHNDGGCSLMNPLSGLKLPLPKLAPAVCRALENSAYDQPYVERRTLRNGYSLAISPGKNHDAISISMPPERPGGLPMRISESNGRLLMVKRWMSFPMNARLGDYDKTFRFDVFKADLTTVPGIWTKVENLGGRVLFIGSQCTKSVLASQCEGGVQENCIYFMHRVFDNP
ncbi:hypothetical protein BAE44_0008215, partial [Dichanthelium oligosanthes]